MNRFLYLLLISCYYSQGKTAVGISPSCSHIYSVVIDGGSSGTRLNVFKFNGNLRNSTINQTFTFKSKEALSSFSVVREDWSLMRALLNVLIEKSLSFIPTECIVETPLYLQVTAGIRQLEKRIGSRILTNVRGILSKSKFKFQNSFVDILSPTQEGQLAWISINYLLDNLRDNSNEEVNTVGILDLGGGSTQIAFATDNPEVMKQSFVITVLGKEYFLYSKGFDFMGINEARLKYFQADHCIERNCTGKLFLNQCLHPDVRTNFMINNRTISIGGKVISNGRRFCQCFSKGLRLTRSVNPIRDFFGTKKFVAFSAYYFILKSAGEIFKQSSGGLYQTNIRDIIIRAMEVCAQPRPLLKKSRFGHLMCLDLSYIVALLHNGYGFEWYDELTSAQMIKSTNLSWALGYAIWKF